MSLRVTRPAWMFLPLIVIVSGCHPRAQDHDQQQLELTINRVAVSKAVSDIEMSRFVAAERSATLDEKRRIATALFLVSKTRISDAAIQQRIQIAHTFLQQEADSGLTPVQLGPSNMVLRSVCMLMIGMTHDRSMRPLVEKFARDSNPAEQYAYKVTMRDISPSVGPG